VKTQCDRDEHWALVHGAIINRSMPSCSFVQWWIDTFFRWMLQLSSSKIVIYRFLWLWKTGLEPCSNSHGAPRSFGPEGHRPAHCRSP
jgi:hypothetical protein